ncbi:hypothetical protein EGW08_000252 [Elysia chlorotica]|uniref:Delta-like protein n=1 Tax=Elysia chlorotica TaxID=188477 RepID=A0A3S1A2A8_ELYCH|nr:hypothetical protein EGW08_000252 [Elysia chlorotica]
MQSVHGKQERVNATGKLQIYLQTYEFNIQGRASIEPPGDGLNFNLSVPLSFAQILIGGLLKTLTQAFTWKDRDSDLRTLQQRLSKSHKPEWRLRSVFGQSESGAATTQESLTEVDDTKVDQWPWQEKTDCTSPTRYRFVVCLDYEGSYDPSYPCSLTRVETDLLPKDMASPFSSTERVSFRTLLRATQGSNIIPNPFELQFDEWKETGSVSLDGEIAQPAGMTSRVSKIIRKYVSAGLKGPIRLSIFVTCCGASSVHEGQCDEVLTSTISTWPRAASEGSQALRYRLTGRASITVIANAMCDENFYTHSCGTYCKVDNPGTEHAFCNSTNGIRQCLPGYEGPDCQVDVDECSRQGDVCRNGGVCRNSPGSFSCACPFSTTGRTCEQRYPVCHLRPCQHQGTCVETTSGSLCLCMPGFEGQWCHMLEGEEDQRLESPSSRNENSDLATTPRTVAVSTPGTSLKGPSRTKQPHKKGDGEGWHNWYLAIIFAIIFVIVIIFIFAFLICRRKARKRYQVNTDSAALTSITNTTSLPLSEEVLPVTSAPRAKKTRSFNNAVYDDEERVAGSGSAASSLQVFYNNNNGSLGNSHDMYGNTSNITLSNNNILSARALMQQDSTGKVNFKDKTLVKPESLSDDVNGKSKEFNSSKHYNEGRGQNLAVKLVDIPNTKSAYSKHAKRDTCMSQTPTGTLNRSNGYVNQAKPLVVDVTQKNTKIEPDDVNNDRSETNPPGVYRSGNKRGTAPREIGYPRSQTGQATVEVRDGRSDRNRGQPRSTRQSEHFYEDIDSAYTFGPHAPKPKPRSIHNVRSETLRRKDYSRRVSAESDESLAENSDEIDLPLAPPPPPLLSATAVAAVAFSSRVQGQTLRSNNTLPTAARPVSLRYEQPRNSDGSLDYSPSDFSPPNLPTGIESENVIKSGPRNWYGDQYVKSSPHVLSPKFGEDNLFFNDPSNAYCLQQSQRKSTPNAADFDPRLVSRQQWEDKWRNQPILPPSSRSRNQPSTSTYSSSRETPTMPSPREWPQLNPFYDSTPPLTQSNARGGSFQPATDTKAYHSHQFQPRPDSGYVSNQDPSLYFGSSPGGRRGSVDTLLDSLGGKKNGNEGLYESKRSRSGEELHSYGESCALPVDHRQPRRRSEPFIGLGGQPRSSIARENRVGAAWYGGDRTGSDDRRNGSQHGSTNGGSSLSIAPNISSSFV